MHTVLYFLFSVIGAYIALFAAYLLLLSAASWFHRKRTQPDAAPLRLAVAIPAHNEESGIAATVASVLGCAYPEEKRAVFVIADNCTDGTADRARESGAEAAVRTDIEHRGKGQAIEWFLKTYGGQLRAFDGIVLTDADTALDPAFLQEASGSLSHPDVAIMQGYDGVGNAGENWRTALTFAGFAGVNHVRPAGQETLGGAVTLKGCGMAFRSSVLLDMGWPAHGVVEDMEQGLDFLLSGARVSYNPDAVVLSSMPAHARQAHSQRTRWEGGRMQLMARMGPRLACAFLREPRWRWLDALLEVATPPLSMLAIALAALFILALLAWNSAMLLAACVLTAAIAAYVATGLLQRRASRRVWAALALAPLFVLAKLPVYGALLLGRRPTQWVRTERSETAHRDDAS